MSTALLVPDQAQFDQQLDDAGDKPVVVAFTTMTCAKFAVMYSQVVAGAPSSIVFLLVLVDRAGESQAIADANGVDATPSFLYFQNTAQVDSFSDAEAQQVVETLEEKLPECL